MISSTHYTVVGQQQDDSHLPRERASLVMKTSLDSSVLVESTNLD
jgi:hypothetical protein